MTLPSEHSSQPHEELAAVVARLDPILNPLGFTFCIEHSAVNSGGPFENGFYLRQPISIGLIVRGDKLGCPNYVWNEFHTGHDDLIERLGRVSESVLRFDRAFDKWELITTDGSDVVDAFITDLEIIILPTISNAPDLFRQAVVEAHNARLAKWRSGGGK
jgi:hypothetical protein